MLIWQPEKVSTPPDAGFGFAVQPMVPGPPEVGVPAVIDNVIEAIEPVTVLPPASCTVTVGCVGNATPARLSLGDVVNASFDAAPVTTVNVTGLTESI